MCVRLGWPQVRVEVRSGVPVVTADTFGAAVHTADGTLHARGVVLATGTPARRRPGEDRAWRHAHAPGESASGRSLGIEQVDSDGQVHFDAVSARQSGGDRADRTASAS